MKKIRLTSIHKKGIGRKEYGDFLKGKKLTYRESVLAKCYSCTCYYADGTEDCETEDCPLYLQMPYRKKS